MKLHLPTLTLALAFATLPALGPSPLSAQGPPPPEGARASHLAFGLSAGGAGVDDKRLGETLNIGPFFGGRFEWARRESSIRLSVDVQPTRIGLPNQPGDFRAVYILPAYAFGRPGNQIGIALGMGVFDLRTEFEPETRRTGFVGALSGSKSVSRSMSLELGWKRIQNVGPLKANLYTLQLVKLWGS